MRTPARSTSAERPPHREPRPGSRTRTAERTLRSASRKRVVGGVGRAVEGRPQLRGRRPARALVVPRPDSRVERLLLSLGQHGEGTVRRRVVVADALDVHGDGPRQRVERPPELRFRTPERDAEPSIAEDPRSLADEGVILERPADSSQRRSGLDVRGQHVAVLPGQEPTHHDGGVVGEFMAECRRVPAREQGDEQAGPVVDHVGVQELLSGHRVGPGDGAVDHVDTVAGGREGDGRGLHRRSRRPADGPTAAGPSPRPVHLRTASGHGCRTRVLPGILRLVCGSRGYSDQYAAPGDDRSAGRPSPG